VREIAAERILQVVNSRSGHNVTAGEVKATDFHGRGRLLPRHARTSEHAISIALEALTDSRDKRRGSYPDLRAFGRSVMLTVVSNVEIANDLIGALSEARLHLALAAGVCMRQDNSHGVSANAWRAF
jgi:hypothetical protein